MPDSTPLFLRPSGRLLPILLLVLTVFGPVPMDLYLPLLPSLTVGLPAVPSTAHDAGAATMLPLGVVTVASVALAGTAYGTLLIRRRDRTTTAAPASRRQLTGADAS